MFDPGFGKPAAIAPIRGREEFPNISGCAAFYPFDNGTLVAVRICGLPCSGINHSSRIFGLHIHEGIRCKGDHFSETGSHFDPADDIHPYHAGDLPPLFSFGGKAYMAVWTDRFQICDVVGRTVVIHADADDLHTQPSGQSGSKIACGVIRCC